MKMYFRGERKEKCDQNGEQYFSREVEGGGGNPDRK